MLLRLILDIFIEKMNKLSKANKLRKEIRIKNKEVLIFLKITLRIVFARKFFSYLNFFILF